MHFFGGQERETLGQIKTHLMTENGAGACAGAVCFVGAMFVHMAHEVEVSLHKYKMALGLS